MAIWKETQRANYGQKCTTFALPAPYIKSWWLGYEWTDAANDKQRNWKKEQNGKRHRYRERMGKRLDSVGQFVPINTLLLPFSIVLCFVGQFLLVETFPLKTLDNFFVPDLDQLCLTDCQPWVHWHSQPPTIAVGEGWMELCLNWRASGCLTCVALIALNMTVELFNKCVLFVLPGQWTSIGAIGSYLEQLEIRWRETEEKSWIGLQDK